MQENSQIEKMLDVTPLYVSLAHTDHCHTSDTKNWTASKRFCSSQGSELAHIDTREDMDFLRKHAGTSMHWIGLNRKQGESWKWTNGTTFNPWFEISGNGSFAFLNADGVRSSRGFIDIKWICSKPKF
ncbi:C-type lectin domain family 2 member A isoform X4 [Herpailurus yagouaroundi]|uniref:C-type lectin domain family 2 member A isoform X4 n=1 Tax=Herpailurus yagouaroundi TaxID=1608482 RepID=UPI001AD6A52E|nr:C-type lectin domain family 2 member A isoform X4 [Puma yagouaroundi]